MNDYFLTQLRNEDGSEVLRAEHIGHLVPVKCGHRGKPNRIEERLLENLLKESGFL